LISGFTDEASALFAGPIDSGALIPLPQIGDAHPFSPYLICTSNPVTAADGPTSWRMTAGYEVPDIGGVAASSGNTPDDVNPLNRPEIITWRSGEMQVPCDRDLYNIAILNSAGDAPSSPQSRPIKVKYLTIKKYIPFYDPTIYTPFENTVNSGTMTIGGTMSILPGELYCSTIQPTSSYPSGATYVECEFNFELRVDIRMTAPDGTQVSVDPFSLHIVDSGKSGWYLSSDGNTYKSPFCNKYGVAFPNEVLLDGGGQPIDPTVFVYGDNGNPSAPVQNPNNAQVFVENPGPNDLPPWAASFTTARCVTGEWPMVRGVDYSSLGL
jgi:hypothetical protein